MAAGGNLTLLASDGSITSQGTQMSAEGTALLLASKDIVFDVAHNTQSSGNASNGKGWGFNNAAGLPYGNYNQQGTGGLGLQQCRRLAVRQLQPARHRQRADRHHHRHAIVGGRQCQPDHHPRRHHADRKQCRGARQCQPARSGRSDHPKWPGHPGQYQSVHQQGHRHGGHFRHRAFCRLQQEEPLRRQRPGRAGGQHCRQPGR
ncbi:hemagglutinin repeat-containing protein [Xanthomonas arboricola]|uniref:hemagglutinin repeat-containing protein n=1 Tax=Xanthomonas arboricola TaxID=56448 RepID=UPI003D18D0DB